MNTSVREMERQDIIPVVDYFVKADADFLLRMGADINKLPTRDAWVDNLEKELSKPNTEKAYYYIIWELGGKSIGHSNINKIAYGNHATMHLHIWDSAKRQSGNGLNLLRQTIPYYFKNFELQKLICEPYAFNPAPNKTLRKLGFEFIKKYDTQPGPINLHQRVNRYELTKKQFEKFYEIC